jgi:hypothetical protein
MSDDATMLAVPPPNPPTRRSRGWAPFVLAVAAILTVAGGGILWLTSTSWGHDPKTPAARNVGEVPTSTPPSVPPPTLISPNRIEIPKLHIKAPIVDVTTMPDRELEVPKDPKVVGWWNGGAKPGARTGTAILDGHVNYAGVDGALARIGTLNPGDIVYVSGLSNSKQTRLKFKITGVRTYNKQVLPYRQIFDQKSIGRLAIVTCGGPFDAQTGNYLFNIVAFAVPV